MYWNQTSNKITGQILSPHHQEPVLTTFPLFLMTFNSKRYKKLCENSELKLLFHVTSRSKLERDSHRADFWGGVFCLDCFAFQATTLKLLEFY